MLQDSNTTNSMINIPKRSNLSDLYIKIDKIPKYLNINKSKQIECILTSKSVNMADKGVEETSDVNKRKRNDTANYTAKKLNNNQNCLDNLNASKNILPSRKKCMI
jgi:hypothetical protein